jgi:hypothetical protein
LELLLFFMQNLVTVPELKESKFYKKSAKEEDKFTS